MKKYTGKTIFLGIDVHKKTYSITTIDGEVINQKSFSASPEVLLAYCKRAFPGACIKSAYEAGFCGFGLHRFLIENGIDNIVVHPANIEVQSRNLKKTDKRDSKKIAQQLAARRLESVYIPTQAQEHRRYVSRLRETFVKQRTRLAIQLKAFLNVNGLLPNGKRPKMSKKYAKVLLKLKIDENLQYCITKFVKSWLIASKEVKEIEKRLRCLNREEEILYNVCRKIVGFGETISIYLLHELGDTMQFANEAKLFSYCGLTPSEHSSGEHKRLGHITHQGKSALRKNLVQASWVAIRKDPYFEQYFKKSSSRIGSQRAIVAVARKLLGRLRCAMKKREHYIAEKAD